MKSDFLDQSSKAKRYFKDLNLKPDNAGLYIVAKEKGFTGKPKVVDTALDLTDGKPLTEFNPHGIGGGLQISAGNDLLKNDVIVYRGLSDSLDTDQDTWKLQNNKVPAADRVKGVFQTTDLSIDDRIEKFETDSGFLFSDAEQASNTIKKKSK